MASHAPSRGWRRELLLRCAILAFTACLGRTFAAEPVKHRFDLPADSVERSMKRFAAQSGLEVLYPTDSVAGLRTKAVRGEMPAREALDLMLIDTELEVVQDARNGALTVRRQLPNAPRAAPITRSDRPAQNNAAPTPPGDDSAVELSPFVVNADRDVGYVAAESLSGSRLRTSLRDIPAPVSVFTEELLKDLAATTVEEAALYSLNAVEFQETEIGSATGNQMMEQGDTANVNIRGMRTTTTRNYFRWGLNADNYNTSRIDVSRGPNAILFGISPAGGISNVTTKQALMKNAHTAGLQLSSYESYRATVDLNQMLIPNTLALRVNALKDERNDWRPVITKSSERVHVTGTYRPFKHTSLRAEMERGVVKSINAPPFGPFDGISAWIAAGADDFVATARATPDPAAGLAAITTAANAPYFVAIQDSTSPAIMDWNRMARSTWIGAGTFSLFDFSRIPRETVSRGPGNRQNYDYSAQSVWLEQSIGRDLAFQLAWNRQKQDKLWSETTDWNTRIFVDVNSQLPTGAPNPHRGEFFIEETFQYTPTELEADTLQFTGSYELNSQRFVQGLAAKILGRHRIAGLYQEEGSREVKPRFVEVNTTPLAGNSGSTLARNFIVRRTYLGSAVSPGAFNTSGMTDPLSVPLAPQTVTTFITGGATGTVTPGLVRNRVNGGETKVDTKLAVLQSFFWDDRVVTTFGYRRDDVKDRLPQVTTIGGIATDYAWAPFVRGPRGTRRTQGGLVHVRKWLSLAYNQSDNFNIAGLQRDSFERRLRNEEGESKDWGVRLRLFDERVFVSLARYESATKKRLTFTGASGNVRTQSNRIWDGLAAAGIVPPDPQNPGQAAPEHRIDTNQSMGATEDAKSDGLELDLTGNLTSRWSLTFNASRSDIKVANAGEEDFLYLQTHWDAIWSRHAALPTAGGNTTTGTTVGTAYALMLQDLVNRNDTVNGATQKGHEKYKANLITTYRFAEGALKGCSVGGAARYRSRPITFARLTVPGDPSTLVEHRGSPSTLFDVWCGYKTSILSGRYKLDFRLNVKNVFNKDDYRITAHDVNGTPMRASFITPRSFAVSTNVGF